MEQFASDKAFFWTAKRKDGSIDAGYVDTEAEADQFRAEGDRLFDVNENKSIVPQHAKEEADMFFDYLGEQSDESGWYWQTTFIYGVIHRKDFLIEGIKYVPNRYLINKPFKYIYALYVQAYLVDGVQLSTDEFRQRLLETDKIPADWKEGIYSCFKVSIGGRVGITDDEFSSAVKHLMRRQKGKRFDEEITEAKRLRSQGKFEKADEHLTSYLYAFRDMDERSKPISLARMSSFSVDDYQNANSYCFMTPFEKLNRITGGGYKGETWIVGGYTSDGKTQLAKELVYPSMKLGDNVLVVSLEMLASEMNTIFQTRVAYDMGFPHLTMNKIRRRQLTAEEFEDYKKVVEKMKEYGNVFVYQPEGKFTMDDLDMEIDRIKAFTHLDAVVVDYLELVDPDKNYESYRVRIKEIMRRAKRLSTRKDLWVILPHQVSRDGRKRAEKRTEPYYTMADLQESSGVEQNCVVMTWIYQDEFYRGKNRARMGVAKNRMGKVDTVGWEIGTDWEHCRIFEDGLTLANSVEVEDEKEDWRDK